MTDETPKCYVCDKPINGHPEDAYCAGCKKYFHEACDSWDPPMGHGHDPGDHMLDPEDRL